MSRILDTRTAGGGARPLPAGRTTSNLVLAEVSCSSITRRFPRSVRARAAGNGPTTT
ncbi:hypothetical protein V3N99_14955 [Dermatophilaceae bacterium Soc4.6]